MNDTPQILSDECAFISALESAGCTIKGRTCTCPFHDDKSPSAQWSQGNDGTWRVYCHVCKRYASTIDLLAHVNGKDAKQAFKDACGNQVCQDQKRSAKSPRNSHSVDIVLSDKREVATYASRIGKVEAWHVYGPSDNPTLVVARILPPGGKKTFRQFTPVEGGWVPRNKVERGSIPLYRKELFTDRVLVVEGEKCVEAALSVGISATSSAMGAGKAAESDWSSLVGRTAYLWPDNDDTGRNHMADVAKILEGLGVKYHKIDTDEVGLPVKGDVADLIDALDSKSKEEIHQTIIGIMDDAHPESASDELKRLIDDIVAGKYCAIKWPGIDFIGSLSKCLLPGCITTLCADPGAGKSMLMLQMLAEWHREGIEVALLALEDEREKHMQRILAQTSHNSLVMDDEWVKNNASHVLRITSSLREELDLIGERIKAEGEDQLTLTEISEWIENKAKAKCRIIIVDPVTAAKTEKEPWAADAAFIMKVKRIATNHECSVILVTHPRGSSKGPSLGGMAGGSAYQRFSHCALWLEKFECQSLRTIDGDLVSCNRAITITKSRHGRGGGMKIGLLFNGDTLLFGSQCCLAPDDINVIKKKRKEKEQPKEKEIDRQLMIKDRAARNAAPPSDKEDVFI